MFLQLHSDWKLILKKAWSIRLIILVGILSGVETLIPLFGGDIPHQYIGYFSAATLIISVAALIARIVMQEELQNNQQYPDIVVNIPRNGTAPVTVPDSIPPVSGISTPIRDVGSITQTIGFTNG